MMRKKQMSTKQKNSNSKIFKVEQSSELLPFLLDVMKASSRNSVKSILTRGQVAVDGKMVKQHNHLLEAGQTVEILTNQAAMKEDTLEGIEILFEDDDLIAIDKDAGILSVAAKDEEEMTAYRQLKQYVKKEHVYNKVFVVHRLDRDTSGVMIFAKSEEIKKQLQESWNETVKERSYVALVEGEVRRKEGTISSWLKESKTFKVHSNPTDNGGQHAITHYKVVQGNKQFTLVDVQLETGRKNQIRVHMEDLGHPVVGDKKYGASSNPIKRLGLHASALALLHPKTGELIRFQAAMPTVFKTKSKS